MAGRNESVIGDKQRPPKSQLARQLAEPRKCALAEDGAGV